MNLEKIEQIIAKLATAKGVVLLLIVGVIVFFIIKNFSFFSRITFELSPEKISKSEQKKPAISAIPQDIKLRQVQITPVLLELPPYFLAEFSNTSNFPAQEVEFLIDLGASKVEKAALRPKDKCSLVSQDDLSQIRVRCTSLNSRESVFVQAILTVPVYRKIVISLGGEKAHEIVASSNRDGSSRSMEFQDVLLEGLQIFVVVVGAILLLILGYHIVSLFSRMCESLFRPRTKRPKDTVKKSVN